MVFGLLATALKPICFGPQPRYEIGHRQAMQRGAEERPWIEGAEKAALAFAPVLP